MITRRDILIAVAAVGLTVGAFALADKPDMLGSTTFDWNSIPAKTTEVGSVRQVVSRPTATLENLEVHITTLNPGKSPHPPHRHPNEEMLIIRQGTLEAFINGEWKRVGPGSVIFFASNQLHGVRNVGDDQAIYHVVNWKTAATPAATPDAAHP
jgi:XRE family transcriptional regulator, regulator of sulfur utilization